jgi:hypothetical protein
MCDHVQYDSMTQEYVVCWKTFPHNEHVGRNSKNFSCEWKSDLKLSDLPEGSKTYKADIRRAW